MLHKTNLYITVGIRWCLLLFFFVLIKDCSAQNIDNPKSTPIMLNQSHYPRIEVYSEIDKGDSAAGSQKWTDPSGKTVYGGKADYQPHILQKTYLIDPKQKEKLLQTPLYWLPYFGVQKENITLEQYFEAVANTDRYSLYSLLPQNLSGLFLLKEKDENYPYYSTLLVYKQSYPQSFTVVWLDENTWFVNEVYYSNRTLAEFMQNGEEKTIMKAKFSDFLHLSPIFQYKLTEGFPSIKLNSSNNPIPLDEVVLSLALSPGMPNTQSYDIQIAGDGSIMQQGQKSNKKIDLNQLTNILLEAQKLDWASYTLNTIPKPHVHDGQSLSISAWKDGRLYRIQDLTLSKETTPLSLFVKKVQQLLQIK